MIVIILTIIAVIFWYIKFRLSRRNLYKLAAKMPSVLKSNPLIGSATLFYGTAEEVFQSMTHLTDIAVEKGGVLKVWVGHYLYILIVDPVDAEIVLNNCLEKERCYNFLKVWIGNGLLTGPVSIWRSHRKDMVSTFNQKTLDSFVPVFGEHAERLVLAMTEEVGKGKFDAHKYLGPCTLDIVCEAALGIKVGAQKDGSSPYIRSGRELMDIFNMRLYKLWMRPEWLFNLTPYAGIQEKNVKIVHQFTDAIVKNKIEQCRREQFKKPTEPEDSAASFLSHMVSLWAKCSSSKSGDVRWSGTALREQADTITIAGSDTSASTLACVLVMLGSHLHVQDKVIEEQKTIFGCSKRAATKEDLIKMKYLDRVIKETMRLYPILPFYGREVDQDLKLTNYTIPAGASCIISSWGIHRLEEFWGPDVNSFLPDRFLAEKESKRPSASYLAFSFGPRNCIGRIFAMMAMKSILSHFLRHFEVFADNDIRLQLSVFLKPVDGYKIIVKDRSETFDEV